MRTLLHACLLLLPLACHAQANGSDADDCRNGLFPREQESLSLGVVQGRSGEKVHFFDDMDGCPSKGEMCKRPAYLLPGDHILVGKRTADWACVRYQGKQHESVSWVPRKNVTLLPAQPIHPMRDWVGLWSDGLSTIRFAPAKDGAGQLQMTSRLRWDGGVDSGGERRMNFGGMTGSVDVQGAKATASEHDCQVALTRIGHYLVADDNGNCGGMNVRHTGVYSRR